MNFNEIVHKTILEDKINFYGRKVINVEGKKIIFSNIVNSYDSIVKISDFKELPQGCETYIEGRDIPMRFCIQTDKLETITQVKRLIPVIFRTLSKSKIISILYFRKNWQEYVDYIHHVMRDVFAEPKYYNQPTRELYRVLSNKGIDKIRDILCAIIEYDSGYRYRFQYMVSELDKVAFQYSPRKELKRLIKYYNERNQEGFLSSRLGSLSLILLFVSFRNKLLKRIVREIKKSEIELSKEDIYWMNDSFTLML